MALTQVVTLYDQPIPATGNPGARLRCLATVLTRQQNDPPDVLDTVELAYYVVHPSGRLIPVTAEDLMRVRALKGMP